MGRRGEEKNGKTQGRYEWSEFVIVMVLIMIINCAFFFLCKEQQLNVEQSKRVELQQTISDLTYQLNQIKVHLTSHINHTRTAFSSC